MSTPRKRPHCRACGSLMAGHPRRYGMLVCSPASTLPSPPVSPALLSRKNSIQDITDADFEIPKQGGVYRRRNPNWDGSPRTSPSIRGGSVSTMPADDDIVKAENGYPGYGWDGDDANTTDDEDDNVSIASCTTTGTARIGHALKSSVPLASIFSTPKDQVAQVQEAAKQVGLFCGLLKTPQNYHRNSKETDPLHDHDDIYWTVVGRNAEAVTHLLDLQGRGIPGSLQTEMKWPAQTVGLLQIASACIVSSALVVFAISFL